MYPSRGLAKEMRSHVGCLVGSKTQQNPSSKSVATPKTASCLSSAFSLPSSARAFLAIGWILTLVVCRVEQLSYPAPWTTSKKFVEFVASVCGGYSPLIILVLEPLGTDSKVVSNVVTIMTTLMSLSNLLFTFMILPTFSSVETFNFVLKELQFSQNASQIQIELSPRLCWHATSARILNNQLYNFSVAIDPAASTISLSDAPESFRKFPLAALDVECLTMAGFPVRAKSTNFNIVSVPEPSAAHAPSNLGTSSSVALASASVVVLKLGHFLSQIALQVFSSLYLMCTFSDLAMGRLFYVIYFLGFVNVGFMITFG